MTEEELMREDEEFSKTMLLLDSSPQRITPLAQQVAQSRISTALEEEFAVATLLLDSFLTLEEDFAASTLLLDSSTSLEEEFVMATLLLDSSPQRITPLAQQVAQSRISLSLGVTGEELPSSSQAARRSKLEIAKAIILFDFFKAT
jgi:hypothetical protein